MKIYTKILLITMPLILVSLLASVLTTYYFSHRALTELAEQWLETKLVEAVKAASEREEMLRRYSLEGMAASVKQAKLDAGASMLSIEIGKGGFIFIIDSQGIIVMHPDSSLVGKDVSEEIRLQVIDRGRKGDLSYYFQGESHLAMYQHFQPWQWHILATAPKSEVYGVINRMGPYVLLLGTLGSLLMALALMVMTRRLIKPLQMLEAGAKEIGQGRLETRIAVHTNDEFGSLAEVFNKMAAQLGDSLTALKRSEKHFRSLIENASDIITILDKDGTLRYSSPSVRRGLGYEMEEIIGTCVFDFIHPDDVGKVVSSFKERISFFGINPPIEFRFRHKNGSWHNMEAISNNLFDDPKVEGMVVNSRDITQRKRIEEALSAEKERLGVTLRSIGDGVITTDVEGKITLVNKAAEELTGYCQDEAFGRSLTDVFHIIDEKSRQPYDDPTVNVIKTGETENLQNNTVLMARDGTERIIAASAAPIFDGEGKIIGVVLVFDDVTEGRRVEEELLKVQKLESIGLLAGGIAHDFNNILTAIIGNLSLAKIHAKPGDKIFERLQETEKASLRAKDLTQQLLTFSRGGKPIKKALSISRLILDSARFSLRGSNVRCEFSIPDNLRPVEVDEGQISQVINNIIINADQSMPEGGIVAVSAETLVLEAPHALPIKSGKYIKISIQDHGIGIEKEHLNKVFDPYFTTKEMGNGLGLTTAYSIIQKHNGHIAVESESGLGATFHIYLPALEHDIKEVKDRMPRPHTEKGRILVMDDEEFVREIAGEMLNYLGYDVEFARDGEEALQMYQKSFESESPFDIIIMDLTIPGGMGGKETTRNLLEKYPGVKAVVSSGYSDDPVMADFGKYGFSGVISKPYKIEELSKTLYELL